MIMLQRGHLTPSLFARVLHLMNIHHIECRLPFEYYRASSTVRTFHAFVSRSLFVSELKAEIVKLL